MTRSPGPGARIERDPQHLLVPLGALAPMRRRRRPSAGARAWRRRGPELVAALGLLLACAAVLVTLTRPPLSVYLEGDTVHVAGALLSHPAGNGGLSSGRLYAGAATLLLAPAPHGGLMASAITYLRGERVTGVCRFGPPTAAALTERCTLRIGRDQVTCDDTLRFAVPGTWERHCSDGQELRVEVPSGTVAIPMPFPLGR
jgi:hypothetical protein